MLGFAVDELVLEFANREMAEVEILGEIAAAGRDVAAGVVDVKNYYVETADDVAERIDAVLAAGVPAERLTLVPDCGFSQTAALGDDAPSSGPSSPAATSCSATGPAREEEHAMNGHAITMLGTGLIGDFYTNTLHGQRGRDRVRVVYSRSAERGAAFRERWDIPEHTTDLAAAINHPDTDVVVVGAAELPARGGGRAGGRGRQGRPVHEAARADRRGGAPDARRRSRRPASSAATSRTCATRPRRSRRSRRSGPARSAT